MYSNEEKADMIRIYYLCQRNSQEAAAMYFNNYPERMQPAVNMFQRLERNIKNYGSFNNLRKKYGSRVTEQENNDVLNQVFVLIF